MKRNQSTLPGVRDIDVDILYPGDRPDTTIAQVDVAGRRVTGEATKSPRDAFSMIIGSLVALTRAIVDGVSSRVMTEAEALEVVGLWQLVAVRDFDKLKDGGIVTRERERECIKQIKQMMTELEHRLRAGFGLDFNVPSDRAPVGIMNTPAPTPREKVAIVCEDMDAYHAARARHGCVTPLTPNGIGAGTPAPVARAVTFLPAIEGEALLMRRRRAGEVIDSCDRVIVVVPPGKSVFEVVDPAHLVALSLKQRVGKLLIEVAPTPAA